MKFIIEQLQHYSPLSSKAAKLIENQITLIQLKKGEILSSKLDQPKLMYFVQKGLVKIRLIKDKHVRTHFIHSSDTSFIHFGIYYHSDIVGLDLTALEDITVYAIPYSFFEILSYESNEINHLFTRMICLDELIYSREFSAHKRVTYQVKKNSNFILQSLRKIAAVFL